MSTEGLESQNIDSGSSSLAGNFASLQQGFNAANDVLGANQQTEANANDATTDSLGNDKANIKPQPKPDDAKKKEEEKDKDKDNDKGQAEDAAITKLFESLEQLFKKIGEAFQGAVGLADKIGNKGFMRGGEEYNPGAKQGESSENKDDGKEAGKNQMKKQGAEAVAQVNGAPPGVGSAAVENGGKQSQGPSAGGPLSEIGSQVSAIVKSIAATDTNAQGSSSNAGSAQMDNGRNNNAPESRSTSTSPSQVQAKKNKPGQSMGG